MYSIPEFDIGDKVLVRNHSRDVVGPKYDVPYCVVKVIGR